MDTFTIPSAPNAEAIDVWNEILAPKFIRFRRIMVDSSEPHGRLALDAMGVDRGARVLDLGCGFGETTADLARRVGPDGLVVGLDCCRPLLSVARLEAEAAGRDNVVWVEADGQTWRSPVEFDLCFSRFGTMFFANPVAALRNIRTNLRPDGRLVMSVWRGVEDNPWLGLAKRRAAELLPPIQSGRSCGPGPFSMSDPEVVRAQLEAAGYTDVRIDRVDAPVFVGATVQDAAAFQLNLGPAGELVREAGRIGEQLREALASSLRELMQRFETPRGVVMGSSSWCVSARNPG